MAAILSRLQSPSAVQSAIDEFVRLGRTGFLAKYGYGKSRDYLVRDSKTGELCDSKAIVGAAYGHQFPENGPLLPDDFSGGEATVVPKLRSLGFETVRIGEDWSHEEVRDTVSSYFDMLRLEAEQTKYKKTDFNAALRRLLRGRTKGAVELKYQNVSSVLLTMDLPCIPGYKPRGNVQLLLRQAIQDFVHTNPALLERIVDSLEEVKSPSERKFRAVQVNPPSIESVAQIGQPTSRVRLPRKVDFAARDESNRKLGRAGEQWAIDFEHQRLIDVGKSELIQRVDWVSERLGDGAGYDILSYDAPSEPRYIEVKTTNGAYASSFIVSRNELDFSQEAGDAFFLYRLFQFRQEPSIYILNGNLSSQLHLEPIDYRASFRRIVS